MKASMLIRTRSFPTRIDTALRSPGLLSRSASLSPLPGLQAKAAERRASTSPSSCSVLRRASSESDLVAPSRTGLVAMPPRVVEEEMEELECSGGGMGKGRKVGGGWGGGEAQDDGERDESRKISEYYQELLRNDPGNELLLRNYGKFLHEVEGDVEGAEELYGRAILTSPGDGDVLSLYGKLVWETHGDKERADAYFQRAVEASPNDCYVLASYAHFLWDTEKDEGESEKKEDRLPSNSPLVGAF